MGQAIRLPVTNPAETTSKIRRTGYNLATQKFSGELGEMQWPPDHTQWPPDHLFSRKRVARTCHVSPRLPRQNVPAHGSNTQSWVATDHLYGSAGHLSGSPDPLTWSPDHGIGLDGPSTRRTRARRSGIHITSMYLHFYLCFTHELDQIMLYMFIMSHLTCACTILFPMLE